MKNTLSSILSEKSLDNLKNFKLKKLKVGKRKKVLNEKLSFTTLSKLWKQKSKSEVLENLFTQNKLPKRLQKALSNSIITDNHDHLEMHKSIDDIIDNKKSFIRQAFHLLQNDEEILQELINSDLEISKL